MKNRLNSKIETRKTMNDQRCNTENRKAINAKQGMDHYFYWASVADFKKIPRSTLAYWMSDKVREIFTNSQKLGDIAAARQGLATADIKCYKKRPIYWLFSSGKQKAFECLVYLHRYNESTLAKMRTEYVTPLLGKYSAYIEQLNKQSAEANRLKKEQQALKKKQTELRQFDDKLKHYADMRIKLDLDDGVKVNYGKFGDLLAEVKAVTGSKGD
jgi:hypothetical protein